MTPPHSRHVLADQRGDVLLVTFNRREKLNAWCDALEDEYFDLLQAADADPGIRAIVVTGAGRGFCSGADMDDLRRAPGATAEDAVRPRPRHLPMTVRKPLIAAVHGAAAGLGLVEALYADIRFATPDARFLSVFARRGLIAEYGIAWLLPRVVGHSRALDILMSAREISGSEAYRIGLVDHLSPAESLVEDAVAYARELAECCSPTSVAVIKQQVLEAASQCFSESARIADELMLASFSGPDLTEGIASFTERRASRFSPLTTRSPDAVRTVR